MYFQISAWPRKVTESNNALGTILAGLGSKLESLRSGAERLLRPDEERSDDAVRLAEPQCRRGDQGSFTVLQSQKIAIQHRRQRFVVTAAVGLLATANAESTTWLDACCAKYSFASARYAPCPVLESGCAVKADR